MGARTASHNWQTDLERNWLGLLSLHWRDFSCFQWFLILQQKWSWILAHALEFKNAAWVGVAGYLGHKVHETGGFAFQEQLLDLPPPSNLTDQLSGKSLEVDWQIWKMQCKFCLNYSILGLTWSAPGNHYLWSPASKFFWEDIMWSLATFQAIHIFWEAIYRFKTLVDISSLT